MAREGIGPAIKSGILAADAVEARLGCGVGLDAYAARVVRRYGSGEMGWLGRQLARIPEAWARRFVHVVLNTEATRRHLVFGRIFGMREVAS